MPTDFETLNRLIRTLENDFLELDAAKYATGQIRDQRTMRPGGRLGPASPGRVKPIELSIELELRLHEFITDAKRFITPARHIAPRWPVMLRWARFNAQAISELNPDWVDEFAHELRTQHAQITRITGTVELAPPDTSDPFQPAHSIITICSHMGYRVTRDQLRQATCRGHITAHRLHGKNLYKLSEVLAYLKSTTRNPTTSTN